MAQCGFADLQKIKIKVIFAAGIEIWCNGSTTDFGSVCPSSNLGISTKNHITHYITTI